MHKTAGQQLIHCWDTAVLRKHVCVCEPEKKSMTQTSGGSRIHMQLCKLYVYVSEVTIISKV